MKTLKFKTDNEVVLKHPAINDCLIYDIETNGLDVNNVTAVFIGMYSYKYSKYFMVDKSDHESVQRLIDEHRVLVGFNNKTFDNVIMENQTNRYDLSYKVCFDCLSVLYDFQRKRSNRDIMIMVDGKSLQELLPNRKLKTVAEVLKFPIAKGDIDYNVFKQETFSDVELKDIYTYLYKDVELTRLLFEFYITYFAPYAEYVNDKNIRNFDYIRSSGGSYAYSAICHLAGIEPEFESDTTQLLQKPVNHGGYVLEPQVPYAEGTVVYADWASLYPHLMIMGNLFSPFDKNYNHEVKQWKGGKMFPELQTSYNSYKMGTIEKVLLMLYKKRMEYKKAKDPREKPLKLLINTIYGISGSPIFKNVFNMTTSGDTTYIGQTVNKYVGKRFEEHGYRVIYGDTDSSFLVLPEGATLEDFREIATKITKEVLAEFPFPQETFLLDIDDVFNKIWLFGKKNYIGLNADGKLVIKGVPIKKSSASQLGQLLLKKLKPMILERQDIKFPKSQIDKMINDEIDKDITIVGQVYNVRSPADYKSTTSIQFQIASHLGEGTHLLIPNKSLGDIGKTKKYCNEEDAKTLTFDELFLDKVYKELEPFIAVTEK